METVILYGILMIILGIAVFLFMKADSVKVKSKKLSFLFICLGVNVIVLPLSLFIGGMATDAPGSNNMDLLAGFLFIQTIPLIMLIISMLSFLMKSRK